MGRVSCSRAAFDVVIAASRWILVTTASSRPSRPEFQHPSPTFRPWILAAAAVALPVGGQAPAWGMPPWTTLTPQSQRPSSLPSTVSHSCLLSIVPFVIWGNVECLTYLSIYVFKHPSLSVRCDFIDGVLNMGGSGENKDGGTSNDAAALWSSCAICDIFVS
jgi:hypothetical protein